MLDPVEKIIAENVERLRVDKELSYRQLGAEAGVSFRTIQAFVAGKHSPRYGFVFALARALGVETADLEKPTPITRRNVAAAG